MYPRPSLCQYHQAVFTKRFHISVAEIVMLALRNLLIKSSGLLTLKRQVQSKQYLQEQGFLNHSGSTQITFTLTYFATFFLNQLPKGPWKMTQSLKPWTFKRTFICKCEPVQVFQLACVLVFQLAHKPIYWLL